MIKNRAFFVFILALIFSLALPVVSSAVLIDDEEEGPRVPTGLLELEGYRYPVMLLVPDSYTHKLAYPMVVAIPDEGKEPKEAMQYWESMAKRRNMIVLASTNLRPEDLPTRVDEWILGIMKDVSMRYRVDKKRIYLFGKDAGAHYAAYLATEHPEAFSAVALINGSWMGKYEELVRPRTSASEQIPFLIFISEDREELYNETMSRALKFESKGYSVQVNKVVGEDSLTKLTFKKQLFELMETKSQEWQDIAAESGQTFKERFRTAVKEFFAV